MLDARAKERQGVPENVGFGEGMAGASMQPGKVALWKGSTFSILWRGGGTAFQVIGEEIFQANL